MTHPNTAHLVATSARIADAILLYCRQRAGRTFHADDLRRHVDGMVEGGCAPASADRVLRDLRQKGVVRYTVIDRSKSLYQLEQDAAEATRQADLFGEPITNQEHPAR
jgi:hypothetical protein